MRIAQVVCLYPPDHLGGAPQHVRQLAIELRARRHDLSIFAGRHRRDRPMLESTEDSMDGIAVVRVNTVDAFKESDRRNWWHEDVESHFRHFLAKQRPDVVHFHAIQSLGASLLQVARDFGARAVVSMHDLWWVCPRLFCVDREGQPCIPAVTPGSCACEEGTEALAERNSILRGALDAVAAVITPSPSMAARLRASGLTQPLVIVGNGVDRPLRERPRRHHERPLRVLFAASSHPVKGWPNLLSALRLMRRDSVSYHATLYGLDEHVLQGGDAAAVLDLPVTVHPPFPPDRLDEVLAEHDVLVLPSQFESSSLLVREALVRGVPVVATRCGGPEDVIEDGANGLLVPIGDPMALAEALERLAREPALFERMSAGALATAIPTPHDQGLALERIYTDSREPPSKPHQKPPGRKAPRVLFIAGIEGAPLRYRVHNAIEQLALQGFSSSLRHYADPEAAAAAERADAIIVYRSAATKELVEVVRSARRRGIPSFFDVDDLIFDPDLSAQLDVVRSLPTLERKHYVEGVRRYRAMLEECGAGIASTPEIARAMQALGVPASVHPNGVGTSLAVASELARRVPRERNEFTIGYFSGTKTHDHDFALIGPAVAQFLAEHPRSRLVVGGPVRIPRVLEPMSTRVERVPLVPWPRLPYELHRLHLLVNPLSPTVFNEAKSAIKWSEAALVDVPTAATATEPFRLAVADGVTGQLVFDGEWATVLQWCHDDQERLRAMAARGRTAAFESGSPWVLGPRLAAILTDEVVTKSRTAESGTVPWPSDQVPTTLEPPRLWPGLASVGEPSVPAMSLGSAPLRIELPAGLRPLRRVDILTATHGMLAAGPLRLRVRTSAGTEEGADAPAARVSDSGWTTFCLAHEVEIANGVEAEVTAGPDEHTAVWLDDSHVPIFRTFHEPPVPPERVASVDALMGWGDQDAPARWRVHALMVRTAWRRSRYWWKSLGPVGGSRRIGRAMVRRLRIYLRR